MGCRIIRIKVWEKKENPKCLFTGYFNSFKSDETIKRMFSGMDVRIETHVIGVDDEYYLEKARKVIDRLRGDEK